MKLEEKEKVIERLDSKVCTYINLSSLLFQGCSSPVEYCSKTIHIFISWKYVQSIFWKHFLQKFNSTIPCTFKSHLSLYFLSLGLYIIKSILCYMLYGLRVFKVFRSFLLFMIDWWSGTREWGPKKEAALCRMHWGGECYTGRKDWCECVCACVCVCVCTVCMHLCFVCVHVHICMCVCVCMLWSKLCFFIHTNSSLPNVLSWGQCFAPWRK